MGGDAMFKNSIRLFTLFGIPINIHVSWLIIFFLITWSLAAGYFPQQHPNWDPRLYWVIGVITSLLFFLSVLLHELSHSVVARLRGMEVRDIVLFVFGGVSEIKDEPSSAGAEFVMAFVGPLTSFIIGGICFGAYLLLRNVSEPAAATARYLFWINILLGAFNLVPGFPLDGGRVLRSIVWGITRNLEKATRWAVHSGMFVAYGLIFLGIWTVFHKNVVGGLWFIFIGWFLNNAAQSALSQSIIRHMLSGHTVQEVVNRDCPQVPEDLPLDVLVHDHILAEGRRCLPVVEDGHIVGIVTVHNVKQAPRDQWPRIHVRDVMVPMEQVKAVGPEQDLWTAFRKMGEENVNQLAVMEGGRFVGMVGRNTLMDFIRLRADIG
jgi:Zn-dependent protease